MPCNRTTTEPQKKTQLQNIAAEPLEFIAFDIEKSTEQHSGNYAIKKRHFFLSKHFQLIQQTHLKSTD